MFTGFVGLEGPAVALEYLEYGDIIGLQNKLRRAERIAPNRILWSLLFCCMYFYEDELSHASPFRPHNSLLDPFYLHGEED